jgi:hypothetical protein
MEIRRYQLTVRNKPAAIALAAGAVLVGGTLLALGLALLAGLVVAGAVVASGTVLYRRLRGRQTPLPRPTARAGLNPADEVFLPPPRGEQ